MKNIFWLPLIASLLMAACTDKELDDNIIPRDGEEVNFSVSVNDNKSRTLYGDEAEDGKSVVVNWVKGDKVLVYGTTCSNPSAEYKVGDAADGKNYAGELVKTGAAGIQWGTKTMSDFYSVYPSNSKITPNTTDADGNVTSVKVTTEIRKHQNVTFKKNTNGVWVGQHFSDDSDNPTMTDAVMYAVEKGVTAGQTVNLGYKPFTTVLRFNFAGYQAEGEMGGDINSKIYVNKITINSPFAISGKFSMMVGYDEEKYESFAVVDEENLKVTEDNCQIVIYPDYLPLANAEQLQFDVFAIPQDYVLTNDNYFVVTIETNSGQFTYHMKPTVVDEKKNKMLAGAMHKVNIPMKKISKPFEIPASEWVKYVPRNVYLSELSVPGAWYCIDQSYQGKPIEYGGGFLGIGASEKFTSVSLSDLYEMGVRAFNIDCRVTVNKGKGEWTEGQFPDNVYLACSGTEKVETISNDNVEDEGVKVIDAIKELINLAQKSYVEDDEGNKRFTEFITIVFTYAEKPLTQTGASNTRIFGSTDPIHISKLLKDVLADKNIEPYLYKNVTNNTTVGDILKSGKNILVKINHSNINFNSSSNPKFEMPDGVMASYAPMAMNTGYDGKLNSRDHVFYFDQRGYGNITEISSDFYSKKHESVIYNGNQIDSNGMTFHYCQAQKTFKSSDHTPTLEQRKNAINEVISAAKGIYEASEHNSLFQIGLGGMLDGGYDSNVSGIGNSKGHFAQSALADQLNAYLQTKIEEKLNDGTVSPLGFVLMNTCINHTGLINDILEINTKFYLNRNKSMEEWPEDCGGNPYVDAGEGGGW